VKRPSIKTTIAKTKLKRATTLNHPSDHMPKLGAPKLLIKEPVYNFKQAITACFQDDKKRSRDIVVKKIQLMQNNTRGGIIEKTATIYRAICMNPENRHDHVVTIFIPSGSEFKVTEKFRVDCGCPRHIFHNEYALAKRFGNAYMWRCNGQPPVVTNPGLKFNMCKHSIAAIRGLNNLKKQNKLPQRITKLSPKVSFIKD
jgi:hypothetical protein